MPKEPGHFVANCYGVTVNDAELVAVPPGPVIWIGPLLAPSGTVAETTPAAFTTKVAGVPLNVTLEVETKYVPLNTTVVPTGPLAGVNAAIEGVGGGNPASTSMMAPPPLEPLRHPPTPVYNLPFIAWVRVSAGNTPKEQSSVML